MTDFFNCIADIVQESFKIIPVIGDPLNWGFIAIGSFVFILCAKKFI